jgi:SAM-dependent methyltransferase
MICQPINRPVLNRIAGGTRTLLDIGCGKGVFGLAAKATIPCNAVGAAYSEAESIQARQQIGQVGVADLNGCERALREFDSIVSSHVREHRRDACRVLMRLRAFLQPRGAVIVALFNVLFWKQRLQFLLGRFGYTDAGLMDRTRVHFFDWVSARQLVLEAGFLSRERRADGGVPRSSRLGARLSSAIDQIRPARFPGVFGVQFVLQCDAAVNANGRVRNAPLHSASKVNVRDVGLPADARLADTAAN